MGDNAYNCEARRSDPARWNVPPILEKEVWVSERQGRIIDIVLSGVRDIDEVAAKLGVAREDIMRDVEELRSKGLLRVTRTEDRIAELSEEALEYLNVGLPEERLALLLERVGKAPVRDLPSVAEKAGVRLSSTEARIGLQHLVRRGLAKVEKGVIRLIDAEGAKRHAERVRGVLEALRRGAKVDNKLLAELKRRGLVVYKSRKLVLLEPTDRLLELRQKGLLRVGRVITVLTPKIIASGEWRRAAFKAYDLTIPPPTLYPGKRHPYLEFLDMVREILVSMGFEEMKGPHVELELWNFDALFQAQDHPAREIHDTYFLKNPRYGRFGDEELMRRIARVHEDGWTTGSKGWGYKWDPKRALRLILRTQTTAVSARTLYARGDGEYRCFSLDRVFRPENLDAKHSMEFYQLEGIIVGRRVTFRHLIGFFEEMARRLGLGPVKIKPAYFPFTEPSVEGFIKHPKLGWIEVFPGGMFRPEMLAALGVKECNVAAWGIGIDRIAMTVLGIDDIRLLFAQDLQFLREAKRPVIRSLLG